MVCKNCGTKIPMGGKFCPNCRWKVTKEKEDKTIKKLGITCSRCGAAIPEGGKFCPKCRYPAGKPFIKPEPRCSRCGSPIPKGLKECPGCGYPVKPGGRDPKPLKDWWDVLHYKR